MPSARGPICKFLGDRNSEFFDQLVAVRCYPAASAVFTLRTHQLTNSPTHQLTNSVLSTMHHAPCTMHHAPPRRIPAVSTLLPTAAVILAPSTKPRSSLQGDNYHRVTFPTPPVAPAFFAPLRLCAQSQPAFCPNHQLKTGPTTPSKNGDFFEGVTKMRRDITTYDNAPKTILKPASAQNSRSPLPAPPPHPPVPIIPPRK
jgi:hypothetical protein